MPKAMKLFQLKGKKRDNHRKALKKRIDLAVKAGDKDFVAMANILKPHQ